jgi:hypothetical protein
VFFHVVTRRNATREIVQVNFQTHTGHTWAVFGDHWPSRSGGQLESAGYRQIAGETLSFFHRRVLEVHGPAPLCCHGRLQRRTLRHLTRHPRPEHPPTATGSQSRHPAPV